MTREDALAEALDLADAEAGDSWIVMGLGPPKCCFSGEPDEQGVWRPETCDMCERLYIPAR